MSDLHPAIILDGSRNKGHKSSGSSGSFLDFETLPISSAFSFFNKAHNLVNLAPANGFVPMYSFCFKINGIKLVPCPCQASNKVVWTPHQILSTCTEQVAGSDWRKGSFTAYPLIGPTRV
jgi:hypothetical protein